MSEQGTISVVTGGLSGIGRAIVEALLARGEQVVIFDLPAERDARLDEITDEGLYYVSCDVSQSEAIREGFVQVASLLDEQEALLGSLINCAGITRDGLAVRMPQDDWDLVQNVNLRGTFLCCQEALKIMSRQRQGSIVNVASIVGLHGNAGQANYAASKGGVIALTKSLAKEYASRNILVNAIAPGYIQTPMTDKIPDKYKDQILRQIALRRIGTPQEVAHLAAFLTSGNATYITGQVIAIDGCMG